MVNNDTAHYVVSNRDAAEWEVGLGTWNTGVLLARTTVLASSNSNALVNFSTGTKDVHITLPAARTLQLDAGLGIPIPEAGSTPATPASGIIKLFARERAGRMLLSFIGPSGLDSSLQPGLWGNRVAMVGPGRTTAINTFMCSVQTATTISHPAPGTGSLAESIYRTRFQTSTTAGNASGFRTDQIALRGNGTTARGGFFYSCRFCSGSISLAGGQVFIGLRASNAALSTEPSAITNMLGVGKDIGDTNWQFMRNDGSGTATKVDLGVAIANNQTFDVRIFCAPGGSDVFVLVEQIANTGVATPLLDASYNTDIPTATSILSMQVQVRNGATAAANNIEHARSYIESDF